MKFLKKKKIKPFHINNLRNGVNTVISEILMKQAGAAVEEAALQKRSWGS